MKSLQLIPLYDDIRDVYSVPSSKIGGVIKFDGKPPFESVSTRMIDELPKTVPPVANVEGGWPEPVSISIDGRLPCCDSNVMIQRWPYVVMKS